MTDSDAPWVTVFKTGTDYEAEIVRDRLDDAGIRAVIDTKRDHAFNLNVGDLAVVLVKVPVSDVAAAKELLESAPISDAELTKAALAADPTVDRPESDTDEEGATEGS